MYLKFDNNYAKCNGPADASYSPALRDKINQALAVKREQLLEENLQQLIGKFKNNQSVLFSDDVFYQLIQYPILLEKLEKKGIPITTMLTEASIDENLFSDRSPINYFLGKGDYDYLTVIPNQIPVNFTINNVDHETLYYAPKAIRVYALCQALGLNSAQKDMSDTA